MAKTAKEKTPVMKAADKARADYTKAKEVNVKTDNAATKKALEDAKTARDTAVKAEARERFVSIASARVKKAVVALNQIGKMNQPRSYSYTEEDIVKAEKLTTEANKAAFVSLRAAISGNKATAETGPDNIFA